MTVGTPEGGYDVLIHTPGEFGEVRIGEEADDLLSLTPGEQSAAGVQAPSRLMQQVGTDAGLGEAAAAGASRMRQKIVKAVALSRLHGCEDVDEALGTAAAYGRFATGDVASLLADRVSDQPGRSAGEDASLAQGTVSTTAGWPAISTDLVDGTADGDVT